jgi:hypothetical protein
MAIQTPTRVLASSSFQPMQVIDFITSLVQRPLKGLAIEVPLPFPTHPKFPMSINDPLLRSLLELRNFGRLGQRALVRPSFGTDVIVQGSATDVLTHDTPEPTVLRRVFPPGVDLDLENESEN